MGQVKKQMMNDEIIINNGLEIFLQILSEREGFENDILSGIAKQVIAKGIKTLSEKQRKVVDSFVEKYRRENQCERCSEGNITTLTDYIHIADMGLCPVCESDRRIYMEEN